MKYLQTYEDFVKESLNDPLELPNSRIVSIKGNIITTQAGRKYKLLTTKPSLKKTDLYVDMDFVKSSGDPKKAYIQEIDPNDSYGMSTKGLKKVMPMDESLSEGVKDAAFNMDKIFPEDYEYVLHFQDIEDNGTVEDMVEFINLHANEEMLSRYGIRSDRDIEKLAKHIMKESINEEREYGLFNGDQGRPTKLDKECLEIFLKAFPWIESNIDEVEANGYGKQQAISPPTVSNKGQSRGEIAYTIIAIGLKKPMGRNKVMGISIGLRKRTSGPGTGYLYMKVHPNWSHSFGPDAEGAIEFWDDPSHFLKKLYDEKFKNWLE